MIEHEGVSRSLRSIAIAHNLAMVVDSQRLPVRSSQDPQVGRLTILIDKGAENIVVYTVPANDLTGVVDRIGCFEGVRVIRAAQSKILDRFLGEQHRAVILGSALAIADHHSAAIDPKRFTGIATL